jgi:hypothetical protein
VNVEIVGGPDNGKIVDFPDDVTYPVLDWVMRYRLVDGVPDTSDLTVHTVSAPVHYRDDGTAYVVWEERT